MDFHMRLPRSKKEFALFLLIVSVLSVLIIAPLITMIEMGFSFQTWRQAMTIFPFMWLVVVLLVLLTHPLADKLSARIVSQTDSFNAQITINILCNVLMMSILLTVIGAWLGQQAITLAPIRLFFYKWPRNFAIAFAVELLIAQPIARQVLYRLHLKQDLQNS